jgi:hypothetical protein
MIEKKGNIEDVEMNLNLSDIEDENGEVRPKEELEQSKAIFYYRNL